MKNLLFLFMMILSTSLVAQVKIGDNPQTINENSLLELESNTKTLVVTRISNSQMNAITPLNGAIIYNIDEECLFQFNNNSWDSLCVDVMANETVTSIINNNDGSFTYVDESGNNTIISLSDADDDATNELNTSVVLNGTDLETTDAGGTITTNLSALDQSADVATNATNIATNATDIADHIAADLDTDDTNEIQTVESTDGSVTVTANGDDFDLSVTPFDDTALQNQITTNANDIDTLEAEQITQDAAIATNATDIATNATDIADHIAADLDTDATNEIQTVESTDGSVTVTANGDDFDLSVTPFDDTALQTQITDNADDIDALEAEQITQDAAIATNATDIADHIAADLDTDDTNELNTSVVLNGTDLETTDAGGTITTDLSALDQSADVATNATDIATNATDIADHIAADLDTDDTNELNTSVVLNGTDLETTDAGGTITTNLSALDQSADVVTNATNIATNATDIADHVAADLDTDDTNEIQTVESTDGSVTVTANGDDFDLSVTPFDDTALQNQITTNANDIDTLEAEQITQDAAIATNATDIATNATDIADHIAADLDTDDTNELNTSVVLNGTDLETTDAGGTITTNLSALDQSADVVTNATNIATNATDIADHVAADLDTDDTNEIQTVESTDGSVTVTANGDDFDLSVTPFDDTALQNQITTNANDIDTLEAEQITQDAAIATNATDIATNATDIADHIAADLDTDDTNELNTSVVLNGTDLETTDAGGTITTNLSALDQSADVVTNATNIATNATDIADHIAADLDTDDTNEIQTVESTDGSVTVTANGNDFDLSVTPFDDTALQNQITTNANDIDTLEAEQITQDAAIATNATDIADHIAADLDTDDTNELNTSVVLNGTDLETTDAGGTITTDLSALDQSADVATNATDIATNATDIADHIAADLDTDDTNEIQTVESTDGSVTVTANGDDFDLSVTPFDDTALQNQITTNANDIDTLEAEQITQDAAIATNATDITTNTTDIADHIAADLDTDDTNELNTSVVLNGTDLETTDAGGTITTNLSALDQSADVATNATDIATNATDIADHIAADLDTDDTNEIQTVESTDGSVTVTANGDDFDLSVTPFDDTALQNQITTNANDIDTLEAEQITQDAAIATNATDIADHIAADLDTDDTNEIQTVESTDGSVTVTANGDDFDLSVTPFDDTALQNQITTNANDIDTLEAEQITQDAAIATNATDIADHIAADLDTDDTNELNTSVVLNGTDLETTDAGGTITTDLSALDQSADVATNATDIATNATDIADHIAADLDTDDTNEIQTVESTDGSVTVTANGDDFDLSVTPFDDTALQNQITTNANDIDTLEAEQITQDAAIATNATDIATNATDIADHIAADLDTDDTNELNTSVVLNGTDLETTDAGGTITTNLSALDQSAVVVTNATNIADHIAADLDTDDTNEIQTVESTDGSVTVTANGDDFDLSVTPFDDTALQNQITTNANDIDTLEAEQITQDAAIATNATDIADHIAADLDTDDTNEIQTVESTDGSVTVTANGNDFDLSVTPFDDTALQNQITTNANDIDTLEAEQITQDAAIATNATDIADHIAADLDTDDTNELNTSVVLNGTDLETTDAGGTITTDLSALDQSADVATNATDIATNATDIADHIAADLDTDDTNEIQTVESTDGSVTVTANGDDFDLSVTPFDDTALQNQITTNANDIDTLEAEQITQDAAIATNATDITTNTTDIADHIAADLDTDDTNELNTSVVLNGTDLETTDAGGTITTNLSALDQSADVATNATDIATNATDIADHIAADLDTDDTNEIQTVESTDGSVTVTANGDDFDLSVTPFDDTALQNQITTNANDIDTLEAEQITQDAAIATNATNIATNATDIADHIAADLDTDATNEIQTVTSPDNSITVTPVGNNYQLTLPSSATPSITLTKETIGYTFSSAFISGTNNATNNLFNINSTVTRTATGRYNVVFDNPHPNGPNYDVTFGADESVTLRDGIILHVVEGSRTANGFSVYLGTGDNGGTADLLVDTPWSYQVSDTKEVITNITGTGITIN
ncbi:hypothetical protein [Olleya sp. R77988]|uniref:hypothetical protein n=1 Tax=Olleya sp. R77988 TaxID=3093875 RepID=UPI0037C6B5A9